MSQSDYAFARTVLVGAFVAASNMEAKAIIFAAQVELFLDSLIRDSKELANGSR